VLPSKPDVGLLHGAMALYLARYLNVPTAALPGEQGDRLDDLPTTVEDIRAGLLDTFDRQQQVDGSARLVARHLLLGHPPKVLIETLAHVLLREDAGFHAYQMFEAGIRQFREWDDDDGARRHILIAVVRYLAAHSPTERAMLQTADIARRLMRAENFMKMHRLRADAVAADTGVRCAEPRQRQCAMNGPRSFAGTSKSPEPSQPKDQTFPYRSASTMTLKAGRFCRLLG
jgi:hypothetical protein